MSLYSFYRSEEWEKLRSILMLERTGDDGILRCARCGQPILKAYDCIAHHKAALTEENVLDAGVSLNPDNIELVHHRCHNLIHRRFEGFSRKVYLVYGSPCSGKTSWVNEVARPDDLILDVDRIWDAVCNGGRYNKERGKSERPHRLRSNVFGIRDCIIDQIRMRKGMWLNAYIIGGYPLASDRKRLIDLLQAEPVYIEATLEDCLSRAETERPESWKQYIRDWFDTYVI